jgi:hypothetical protein
MSNPKDSLRPDGLTTEDRAEIERALGHELHDNVTEFATIRYSQIADWLRAARAQAEPSEPAKLLAYEHAHETAKELGYPSLTEALEDLDRLKAAPNPSGELLEAAKPFLDFAEGRMFDMLPDSEPMTKGSPLARRQITAGDLRRLKAAIQRAEGSTPLKMLVDQDWLSRNVATDPDVDVEASSPAPQGVVEALKAIRDGWRVQHTSKWCQEQARDALNSLPAKEIGSEALQDNGSSAPKASEEISLVAKADQEPVARDVSVSIHLDTYDAGLLPSYDGNFEWWQDYVRSELARAHDFYQSQVDNL